MLNENEPVKQFTATFQSYRKGVDGLIDIEINRHLTQLKKSILAPY